MAASNAISSFGAILQRGDGGGPETFTDLAEVRDLQGPNLQLATTAVTHHASPGGWREKIGTLLDGGQVTFELGFLPASAGHKALLTDMTNRTKRNFKLKFPDTGVTTWPFTALVVGFQPKTPVEGGLAADVTLEITGAVSLP